ncbi:hypothetical protein BH20VER2_BH20VER2_10520 [soil metagenome]
MPAKDPRVDAYIDKSEEFAQPILRHLRAVVHAGCPEVEETIKWQFPCFDYKGPLANMASFKEHCVFGFWKAALLMEGDTKAAETAMGHFGRIRSLTDLPPKKVLIGLVKKAAELNVAGVKLPKRSAPKAALEMPDDFAAALKRNKKAQTAFEKFSPSGRREYLEWITSAKREETRAQRLATAIEWIADGKSRNWKYERK